MKPGLAFSLIVISALLPTMMAAQEATDRAAWQARIDAARARADVARDLARRRAASTGTTAEEDRERAQGRSESVRNDGSLQRGDIVSTVDGLFVFVGDPDGDHHPSDFVPANRARR